MNYFTPANQNNQFSADNRKAANYEGDRNSRFRGGFNERRGNRQQSMRPREDLRKVAAQLVPPIDNVLYQQADTIDPVNIDYSFYDLPVRINKSHAQEEIKPQLHFADFISEMPGYLQKAIQRMKYQKLTPIQQYAVPIGLRGCDILATSQTGSGKSAAFLIPAFLNISTNKFKNLSGSPNTYFNSSRQTAQPFVVIMAPTRELALQNAAASWQLSNGSGVLTRVCYGGESSRVQCSVLQQGCDILVATPGRLKDFLKQNIIDCRYVKYLVLDEADVMLDFGFFEDIKEIKNTILDHHRNRTNEQQQLLGQLQTSLFSATFPKEIQQIAREMLTDPYHIVIGEIGVTGMNITQVLLKAQHHNKLDFIKYLASKQGQMLIFCKTKAGVDTLQSHLKQAFYNKTTGNVTAEIKEQIDQMFEFLQKTVENQTQKTEGSVKTSYFQDKEAVLDSSLVGAIHGDLTQAERTENLAAFRSQRSKILIATDVAQRGLDLPKVEYVINYDMPCNIEDYSHRIGRTGRAGRRGCSVTLVTDNESKGIMRDLLKKLSECNQMVPAWYDEMLRTKWLYDQPQRRGGRSSGGDRGGRGFQNRDHRGNW